MSIQTIKNIGAHLRKRERKLIKKSNSDCISNGELTKLLIRAKRTRRNANDHIFMA